MEKLTYDLKDIVSWPPRTQYMVLTIVALVLLYFLYLLDLSILKKQYVTEMGATHEFKKDLQSLYAQEGKLLAEVERTPLLKKQLAEWQGDVIRTDQVTVTLDQLLKLGKEAGLHINTFDPDPVFRTKINGKLPVKVLASGTYDQIATYFSQLVNLNLLIELGDFTIRREESTNPSHPETGGPAGSTAPLAVELHLYVYTK